MKEAGSMVWDYLVFLIFIVATTFVAVYNRYAGPKEKTKADYVFATGSVSMAAMMLSIARGTLGVRSFLGKNIHSKFIKDTSWIFIKVDYQIPATTFYKNKTYVSIQCSIQHKNMI